MSFSLLCLKFSFSFSLYSMYFFNESYTYNFITCLSYSTTLLHAHLPWPFCCSQMYQHAFTTEPLHLLFHFSGMLSQHMSTNLIASPGLYLPKPILLFCLIFLDNTYHLKGQSLLLFYVFSNPNVNITRWERYLSALFSEA